MDISLRLKTVANAVNYRTMADIGTDHGYVPIYLLKCGKIDKAIACDINEGPLKRAKENIKEHGLENKIETRLGNGLEALNINEVETIVISGMGGMLTVEILKNGMDIINQAKQLVLSPHLDVREVRKYLHSIGFMIDDEKMIRDEGKYYTIISAVIGEEKYKNEEDYVFGKINIDKKCCVLKEYLDYNTKKLVEIIESLLTSNTERSLLKTEEIKKELLICEEAIKRYEMQ